MRIWNKLGRFKAFCLLLVLGLLLYGSSVNNSFVLDDEGQVINNPEVHSLRSLPGFFAGSTFSQNTASLTGLYFKPLMMVSYALFWSLDPGNPLPFHLGQLVLATLNAFLLLLFLRTLVSETAAWGAALIFLVHPINSEAILYIADLQDILYMLFGLWALYALSRPGPLRPAKAVGVATVLLASLFAKESGVLYLVASLAYVLTFAREKLRPLVVVVVAVSAAYLYVRLGVAGLNSLTYTMNQIGRADLATRLLTAPMVLAMYLGRFFFPWRLSITQDWVIEQPGLLDFWLPLLLLLAVLCLSVAWGIQRWRARGDRRVLFFAFWVFMGFGFHSHIIAPLDGTFAERWAYFACVGLLGLLGLLFDQLTGLGVGEWLSPKRHPALVGGLALLLGVLGARTYARSLDWQDNYVLSLRDVEVEPNSYYIHNNLGVELFRRGQIEAAKHEFERSTELAPQWDVNWNNLGAAYQRVRDLPHAEECYRRSIANGNYYLAFESYAAILAGTGRTKEAEVFLRDVALPRFPVGESLKLLYTKLTRAPHENENEHESLPRHPGP